MRAYLKEDETMKNLVILIGLFLLMTSSVTAQEVEFNYEGRVLVDGQPFAGEGYFKFAVVVEDGEEDVSVWSNDGSSTTGDEPAQPVIASVTSGVFNVIIGDASQSNMEILSPAVFGPDMDYNLRVWFSDTGIAGTFEQLKPDRKITDARVLSLQSRQTLTLYVNPDTGDDLYSGLLPARPKKTIQAAWDAIPPMVRENVVIQLADGVYYQSALLTGKTTIGDATIGIIGNVSDPTQVHITGEDEGAPGVIARNYCLYSLRQEQLSISGIYFSDTSLAVKVGEGSEVEITDSHFRDLVGGIYVFRSSIKAYRLDCVQSYPKWLSGDVEGYAVSLNTGSDGVIRDSEVTGYYEGIKAGRTSTLYISGSFVTGCHNGFTIGGCSMHSFNPPSTTISDCDTGIRGILNAVIAYPNTNVIYVGNTRDTRYLTGAVEIN
jgi:hypothetical protein